MNVVIALGGNAILLRGEKGTAEDQLYHIRTAAFHIAGIVEKGYNIVITHGNGPQVGDILLKEECASDHLPRMPLDICGAESQGMIGYMLQQELSNEFHSRGLPVRVITLITRALTDPRDPSFSHPDKPVGPYYTRTDAERLEKENGWDLISEPGKGFRRVVPSPHPLSIIEQQPIRSLSESGFVVICAGGGGIPVIKAPDGTCKGVEAVIDKDRTAAILALATGAEALVILTDVPFVYLGYGSENQRPLHHMKVAEAQQLLKRGEFGEGTMKPKIESCIRFVASGGQFALITSLENLEEALSGQTGTRIVSDLD